MAVFEVYSIPIVNRYKTSICSKAALYILCSLVLTFIPPLLIAYRSQGFWMTTNTYEEQPSVRFKKQVLLILDTQQPGEFLAWSTYSNFNNILQDNLRIPLVTSIETDNNGDGKLDQLNFTAQVPLSTSEYVTSLQLLLFFDYRLFRMSTFQMESLAYIRHSSISTGSSFTSFGELKLHQKTPLRHRGVDVRYNTSIVDSASLSASTYDLTNIFSSYTQRNITTIFPNNYPVWKSGRGATQPFTIQVIIDYPTETITYQPGFWELIKWGWVQYVTILLLFLWVFREINAAVFSSKMFKTVIDRPKLKQH
ncbi:transmembrane protein 231-like [Ciona intestinalis]